MPFKTACLEYDDFTWSISSPSKQGTVILVDKEAFNNQPIADQIKILFGDVPFKAGRREAGKEAFNNQPIPDHIRLVFGDPSQRAGNDTAWPITSCAEQGTVVLKDKEASSECEQELVDSVKPSKTEGGDGKTQDCIYTSIL